MIDTGSPLTVIAPKDLMRFRGVSMRRLSRGGSRATIAGHKFKTHEISVSIILRTEKKKPISFESSLFKMMVPTKLTALKTKEVQSIPSILGNDFLEDHNVNLFFDPRDKISYIEFKDIISVPEEPEEEPQGEPEVEEKSEPED